MEKKNIDTLQEIKLQMLAYIDFFGGSFSDFEKIKNAKSEDELKEIFDDHHDQLEMQCNDAQSSLERFKRSLNFKSL